MSASMNEQELELLVRRVVGRMIDAASDTVPIASKLLTLEHLRGIAADTKRLHVAPGTVITPAARDWLKERAITLVHQSVDNRSQGEASSTRKIWLGGSDKALGAASPQSWLRGLPSSEVGLRSPFESDMLAIDDMIEIVRCPEASSLLVLAAPYRATWYVAQQTHVQSAVIRVASDMDAIFAEGVANLLLMKGPVLPHVLNQVLRRLWQLRHRAEVGVK